jgi:hypothetical protein
MLTAEVETLETNSLKMFLTNKVALGVLYLSKWWRVSRGMRDLAQGYFSETVKVEANEPLFLQKVVDDVASRPSLSLLFWN